MVGNLNCYRPEDLGLISTKKMDDLSANETVVTNNSDQKEKR